MKETNDELLIVKDYLSQENLTSENLRTERDNLINKLEETEVVGTTMKNKAKTRGIRLIFAVLLLFAVSVGSGFSVVRNLRYKSLIRNIREAYLTVPTYTDVLSDSARYSYETLMGEQW